MNKLLSIMVLFCGLAISGYASTTYEDRYNEFLERTLARGGHVDAFDEILGRMLARDEWAPEEIESHVIATRKLYFQQGRTADDYKKEQYKYIYEFHDFRTWVLNKQGYLDSFDEILGRRLAELGWTSEELKTHIPAMRKSYFKQGLTANDYKNEEELRNKSARESRKQITKIAEEEKRARENALKSKLKERDQPTYRLDHQPSYDPDFEIRRLRDDLTIQSIIQRGEAEKREKEMMRRLETERSQRESMERVQEQRRQIEQSIQEDNRRHEMHKLRQDLLYKGIY